MDSDDDDLYGQDESTLNGVAQDDQVAGDSKIDELEEGEEDGEQVEGEDSDDVGQVTH
jgi:hypothetical protein